jgi:hypothetical protein
MSTEEGMTVAALAATLSSCFPEGKRISQRMASYTPAEDKVLCEAWLEEGGGILPRAKEGLRETIPKRSE